MVATVLDAQNNGRKALERLQLAQVKQLAAVLDNAFALASTTTGPAVGNETRKSQRLRVSSCKPPPSPPSTIPVGEV